MLTSVDRWRSLVSRFALPVVLTFGTVTSYWAITSGIKEARVQGAVIVLFYFYGMFMERFIPIVNPWFTPAEKKTEFLNALFYVGISVVFIHGLFPKLQTAPSLFGIQVIVRDF